MGSNPTAATTVMIPIDPQTESTLILNSHYQAMGFLTARAVMRHLINGAVKGFDSAGGCYGWKPDNVGAPSWSDVTISVVGDQPCLRGGSRAYAIPTVVILQNSFGMKVKKKESISLRKLYSHYRGTCQYCLQKIPFSIATQDHWYPRDRGGSNHDFNLILACQPCNSKKANIFPYFNVEGKPVKPKPIVSAVHRVTLPDGRNCRDEWRPYLYME